jgi:hypothetical protein
MALDVYVGSLTRYYAGNWHGIDEPAVRRRSQSMPGLPGRAPRPSDATGDARRECERIRAAVVAWRQALAASLAAHLSDPLEWDEARALPWFTGRPDWPGFGALALWAAYAEQPALRRPANLPKDWDDDPALVRSNANGFRSRYSHLVRNVELWLPHPFDFTFEGEDVDGRRIIFGSAHMLARQLADLNAATWKMDDGEMASLSSRPAPEDAALEPAARRAMAVMTGLAGNAVRHRLPIKLDY